MWIYSNFFSATFNAHQPVQNWCCHLNKLYMVSDFCSIFVLFRRKKRRSNWRSTCWRAIPTIETSLPIMELLLRKVLLDRTTNSGLVNHSICLCYCHESKKFKEFLIFIKLPLCYWAILKSFLCAPSRSFTLWSRLFWLLMCAWICPFSWWWSTVELALWQTWSRRPRGTVWRRTG